MKDATTNTYQNFQKLQNAEAVVQRFSLKHVFENFSKFTGKLQCQIFFLIKLQAEACNFFKKETLAQVFPVTFFEFFKDTIFYRAPPVAASENGENITLIESDKR